MKCKECGSDEAYHGITDIFRFISFPESLCPLCKNCFIKVYCICLYCMHFTYKYPKHWKDWKDKRDGFCKFIGIPKHRDATCRFFDGGSYKRRQNAVHKD